MGLFSRKKTITVSSTLYNIAGDEKDRTDYLKATLFNTIMSDVPSTADGIRESYFNGPGLKQRQFFNYAKRQNLRGFPTASVVNNAFIDADVVAGQIPTPSSPAGTYTICQKAETFVAEPEPFIRRWLSENHPAELIKNWVGDYNPQNGQFSVQFQDGGFHTFTDAEYDNASQYIIADYMHIVPQQEFTPTVNPEAGPHFDLLTSDITEGTLINQNPSVATVTASRTDTIWPGGDQGAAYDENADTQVDLRTGTETYEITRFSEVVGSEAYGIKSTYLVRYSDVLEPGYTSQFTENGDVHNVTGERVRQRYFVTLTTIEVVENRNIDGFKTFIYRKGTGKPVLDNLISNVNLADDKEFYPMLPLRIDNHSLRHPGFTDLYDETKKAFRRATNESVNKVLDQIEENDDLDDIDYAYLTYGCALNVKDMSARRYIYEFFKEMSQYQNSNSQTIGDFQAEITRYNAQVSTYKSYLTQLAAMNEFSDWSTLPPKPDEPRLNMPKSTTIRLTTDKITNTSDSSQNGFDFRTTWSHIKEDIKSGNFQFTKEDGSFGWAEKGDVDIRKGTPITWSRYTGGEYKNAGVAIAMQEDVQEQMDVTIIREYLGNNTYREMVIYGLLHQNYIYGGKSVDTTADEALDDNEVSGFLVPLHYPTLRNMNIIDYTQIATANAHIVFNSYEVVKQKWYENFFLMILVMVVVIAVAAFLAPGLFAGAGGILGGNAAFGASIGLTGTAAVVAGAVANYLASIIVTQLISYVSTAVFGDKWGTIIAQIAMMAMGGGFSGGFSLSNIMNLANTLANGYAAYTQASIAEDFEDLEKTRQEYEKEMERIQNLIDGLGGNDLNFDPLSLTDSVYGNGSRSGGSRGYLPETADEFIRRTTMTMSDVIEISTGVVTDFVQVQLTLPRN